MQRKCRDLGIRAISNDYDRMKSILDSERCVLHCLGSEIRRKKGDLNNKANSSYSLQDKTRLPG